MERFVRRCSRMRSSHCFCSGEEMSPGHGVPIFPFPKFFVTRSLLGRPFGLRQMGMPSKGNVARLLATFPSAPTGTFSSCLDLFARQFDCLAAVCPLAPAQVPHQCGEVAAMFLENLFANFPNFIHDRVLHCSFPQQLFRRANNRASIPGVTACPFQLCQDLGIVDMCAIPCQQVVHLTAAIAT